ncbi:hypothetical protein V1281_002610 [Nitrobacteraceae bacterium AZCC 2161]
MSLPAKTTSALAVPAASDVQIGAMAAWSDRGNSKGHDLQLGSLLRLSTTDQTYRGCGWCWHVTVEHDYGNDAVAQHGGCASETEAQAAALAWTRTFCESALAVIKQVA